jgi:hypothetical protein
MISQQIDISQSGKTSPIISVLDSHELKLDEQIFASAFAESVANKLLVLGAVGKMRIGKSSSLNNFYLLLTGRDDRHFDAKRCSITQTRGIHILHVPFASMTNHYKDKILRTFGEEVDVILLDCEGTESSDNVGTSKLYLMNMLINSVIHIHVSTAVDQNFAAKLSQALISCSEIIKLLNGSSLEEILPALWILLKDCSQEGWEEAKNMDPSLNSYEDLLKPYPNLINYYREFPLRKMEMLDTPEKVDRRDFDVTKRDSDYWISLEKIFNESIQVRKLKTKDELLNYMRSLIRVINENNMMNVKTELEGFYQNMFLNEKNKLLKSVILKSIENFPNMRDYSPEEIKNQVNSFAILEVQTFMRSIENISCNWIFNEMQDKLTEDLEKIISQIDELFKRVSSQYKA